MAPSGLFQLCDSEKLAIWLVYRSPKAPTEALSRLLETAISWRLQYPKTIILGDFNIHADEPSSKQNTDLISSMETLGFSQYVSGPTHQAGHTLDLIFGAEVDMDPITTNKVPWSDHFTLKIRLLIPHTSPTDKACIYA